VSSWSPGRHFLYHPGVRSHIHTVHLVAERLYRRHAVVAAMPQEHLRLMPRSLMLNRLPAEMWRLVCSFFCRADWPI
jgi:hypothetical protein